MARAHLGPRYSSSGKPRHLSRKGSWKSGRHGHRRYRMGTDHPMQSLGTCRFRFAETGSADFVPRRERRADGQKKPGGSRCFRHRRAALLTRPRFSGCSPGRQCGRSAPRIARQSCFALGRRLTFGVAHGASEAIRFPKGGPYDERFGYVGLPGFIKSLTRHGFKMASQARWSPVLSHRRPQAVSDLSRKGPGRAAHRRPQRRRNLSRPVPGAGLS